MWFIVIFLFCIITGLQSDPSSALTPCQKRDEVCYTKNADIMYKATILGEPAWGIEPLDPMHQNFIEGNLLVIGYKLRDSTVDGLKNCHVGRTRFSLEKSAVRFELICPLLFMYGRYEIEGQLIAIPIEGNGDYILECKDYYINIDTEVKFTKREDGKRYISFKKFNATSELKGGMKTNLTNLFNGNEALAQPTLKFINEYWKPVSTQLQEPAIYSNLKRIFKNMNKLMARVPLDLIVVP